MLISFIYLLALSIWVGAVCFFSFGVAPSIFGSLPAAQAGEAVATIFPAYYRFGYVCGLAVCIGGALLWRSAERRWQWLHNLVAATMLAATLIAGLVVHPRAAQLRAAMNAASAPAEAKQDFDRLHRRAVQLNGVVLIGGLILIAASARGLARRRQPQA